jgi:uncharacterized protein involved in cysteine biosynthesis
MQPLLAHGDFALLVILLVLVVMLFLVIVAVVVAACAGVLLGIVAGSLLLILVGKKRHLFWMLPLLNACLYLLLTVPFREQVLVLDTNNWAKIPLAVLTFYPAGAPAAVLTGLLAASMVAPFQLLFRRLPRELNVAAAGSLSGSPALDEPVLAELRPTESRRHGLWQGCMTPWFGFVYLCGHRELWRYGVLPIVCNLFITTVGLVLLLAAVATFIVYLHPLFPPGWGWVALEVVCGLVLLLLALVAALVVWKLLQSILCGHYYDRLARQVELQLGMKPEGMREVSWSYHAVDACRDIAALLGVNLGLLCLNVVPVVGSVCNFGGSMYFNCWLFGREYLDFPLALRGLRREAKRDFAARHRSQTLGLGAAVLGFEFVPLVGPLVLTTAVVGAVLLHRSLQVTPGAAHATTSIGPADVPVMAITPMPAS